MSFRSKLVLAFSLSILVPIIIISFLVGYQSRVHALEGFSKAAKQQMSQIDEVFNLFFEDIKENTKMLASYEGLDGIGSEIPSYINATGEVKTSINQSNERHRALGNHLKSIENSHPAYEALFVGTENGGFAAYPDVGLFPGYNPTVRGWYTDAKKDRQNTVVTKAYRSSDGGAVISVAKVFPSSGRIEGVIGIDISLSFLTDMIKKSKVGDSGYMMLVQDDNVIIANPKNSTENFKNITEINNEEYKRILNSNNSLTEVTMMDENYYAAVYTSPKLQWKLIAFVPASEVLSGYHAIIQTITIVGIILLIVFVGVSFFLSSGLSNQLQQVASSLKGIANGLEKSSVDLSQDASSLSAGVTQQASSIQETAASLEEVSGMIESNVNNAEGTTQLVEDVTGATEKVEETLTLLNRSMADILESNKQIEDLVQVISNIEEKTKVMDEIVFQTKLLSFNASVEAERAGEHGRGFAVVAQEVGSLAEMSGKAAQEISTILQASTKKATQITENNNLKVQEGSNLVRESSESFSKVASATGEINVATKQIREASKEQANGVKQINEAMRALDTSVQISSSAAEKAALTSSDLADNVQEMNRLIQMLNEIITGEHIAEIINIESGVHIQSPIERPQLKVVSQKIEDHDWEKM